MISRDTRNFSGQSSKNNRQSRVSLHTIDFTIKLEEPLAESYNRSLFFSFFIQFQNGGKVSYLR